MISDAQFIVSSALPPALVDGHGRTIPGVMEAIPTIGLGLGPFTTERIGDSPAVRLRDARGESCGIFVNAALAAGTMAHLAR